MRDLLFAKTGNPTIQFARYLVVGGVATIADFAVLYALTEFAHIYYLVSASFGFLFGLTVNYLLSRTWVFDRRKMGNSALEFLVFAIIGVIGLGLNLAIIWFLTAQMQIYYLWAKAVSTALVLIWNFGARKAALFR